MRHLLLAAAVGLLTACYGLPEPPAPTNPVRVLLVNDVYVLDTLADGREYVRAVVRPVSGDLVQLELGQHR